MSRRGCGLSGTLAAVLACAAVGRPLCAEDATTAEPEASTAPADVPAPSADPGQDDLDAAIDAKLSARSLDDFARVLQLCTQAVDKGLDAAGRKFADELYIGTLVDRAAMVVDAIYATADSNPQWPQMRAFAMRDLEEIVERDPQLGQAHLMLARLEALPPADTERAVAEARKALELLGDDKLQKARAHVVLANMADDKQERREHFDAAVELSPRDAEIRRDRGMFHLIEDQFEKAREDLAVAVEEDPGDAELHLALGTACAMDGKSDEARQAFDRAVELAPRSPTPLLQRARLAIEKTQFADALADLDRAIELEPNDVGARLLRARIHIQAEDDDAARADVEEVLRRHPDHPAGLELRGAMAANRADYAAAIRDYRRLVAKRPDDADLMSQLGTIYALAEQPRKAIERFSRALELDDGHFASRRGRSDAAISIGDHEAAIADLEVALTLEPDDPGILNNLAWLLATSPVDELRNGTRAVELATKACEATEWRQSHIISTLAAGYAEQGDFETAKKYSRQAIDTGGVSDDVQQQLQGELENYESGKPCRERQAVEDAALDDASAPDVAEGADEPAADEAAADAAEPAEPRPPRRPFDDE